MFRQVNLQFFLMVSQNSVKEGSNIPPDAKMIFDADKSIVQVVIELINQNCNR